MRNRLTFVLRSEASITSRVWLGSALRGPQRSGIHPNLGAAKRRPQPHKFLVREVIAAPLLTLVVPVVSVFLSGDFMSVSGDFLGHSGGSLSVSDDFLSPSGHFLVTSDGSLGMSDDIFSISGRPRCSRSGTRRPLSETRQSSSRLERPVCRASWSCSRTTCSRCCSSPILHGKLTGCFWSGR